MQKIIITCLARNIEKNIYFTINKINELCKYYDNSYCIIFENDSQDNTRKILLNWENNNNKVKILFENNLINEYQLRTQRLAYCRNKILEYIFDNELDKKYDYIINCDIDGIINDLNIDILNDNFKYTNIWDVVGCVNKNKQYYDYWGLLYKKSIFNCNIFSCQIKKYCNDWKLGIKKFLQILNKTENFLEVESCFNGVAIYKMNIIKNCRYDGDFFCNICNGKCINEYCEHVSFHKNITEKNNGKIYINVNFEVGNVPKEHQI